MGTVVAVVWGVMSASEESDGGLEALDTAKSEVDGGPDSTPPANTAILAATEEIMPRPLPVLVGVSRAILGLSQPELARLVESSLRTVQRWEANASKPYPWNLHALADAVRPHDPAVAAELDAWAPRPSAAQAPAPAPEDSLPAREPALAAPPVLDPVLAADAIVCAAAEAMALAPQAVRPALVAAFGRAKVAGLTVDEVLAALGATRERK
jgi:hypothetical protein